jgi:hypothetical protein
MSASNEMLYFGGILYYAEDKTGRSFLMNRMIRVSTTIVLFMIVVGACSTMRTEKSANSFSTLVDNQPYQMRVRSGHSIMDRVIYENALLEFGKYLTISKTDSYKGTIEIIFAGISDSSFLDSTTDFATSSVLGNAWYTGREYIELSGHETDNTAADTIMQKDSTMRVNIKSAHNERLWTADYKYKSELEQSFSTSDTEEKAAKHCIKKIAKKLKNDFPALKRSTR